MTVIEITALLGNLGEFLGSIAVLATLVYLSIQIRMIRMQSENDHKAASMEVLMRRNLRVLNDKEHFELIQRAQRIVGREESEFEKAPFYKILKDGGLDANEIAFLGENYGVIFGEWFSVARTAPNSERYDTLVNECATWLAGSPLAMLWWESGIHGRELDPHEERRKFHDSVDKRIPEAKELTERLRDRINK